MKYYLLIAFISVLILVGGIYLLSRAGSADAEIMSKIVYWQKTDQEKPQLKIVGESHQDIGTMKVTEERETKFEIENVGVKTLQIYSGTSSCNCTFGKVTKGTTASPEFGMHDPRKFLVELSVGERATISVIYKPSIMPVYGRNDRVVTIQTNDPETPAPEFSITAYVE